MANTEIAAPAKVNTPPALHTSALVGDLASGMSLTEIKQLVTQVVPCCTPQTILDSTTGETIILPCCSRAPILPSSSVPLGFTSPRRKDHGPTADLTDASGATENLQSPMVQGTLVVPPHLRLNTSSPANGAAAMNGGLDSFDTRPANTPLALHAPANSPLAQVLTHGPSPLLDAGCELCRDAFQAHQLVKILPECGHAMHSSCIVPYLTHRRDCPSCHTEVLPAGKNKHAELSRLVMQSPSSSQHGEDHLALGGAGTPNGHHVHGTPSTTQRDSGSSSPSHLNVLHLTSPPSAVAKPDLTVSALTSCGAEKDGFNYALDSVKLTPAHPSTIEGQMTQRHAATNGSVPASIKLDQKMKNGSLSTVTSPVVSRSPHAGSPTPPIPVHLESVKCE